MSVYAGHFVSSKSSGSIKFYNRGEPYYEFTNFYEVIVVIDDTHWPTTEHYFQAQKFVGTPILETIRMLSRPREAFDMSRDPRYAHWRRNDWEEVKEDVMYKALQAKFSQNDDLRKLLLGTGKKKLIEHSPYDGYWGDGGDGSGKNRLGELLMRLRREMRARSKQKPTPSPSPLPIQMTDVEGTSVDKQKMNGDEKDGSPLIGQSLSNPGSDLPPRSSDDLAAQPTKPLEGVHAHNLEKPTPSPSPPPIQMTDVEGTSVDKQKMNGDEKDGSPLIGQSLSNPGSDLPPRSSDDLAAQPTKPLEGVHAHNLEESSTAIADTTAVSENQNLNEGSQTTGIGQKRPDEDNPFLKLREPPQTLVSTQQANSQESLALAPLPDEPIANKPHPKLHPPQSQAATYTAQPSSVLQSTHDPAAAVAATAVESNHSQQLGADQHVVSSDQLQGPPQPDAANNTSGDPMLTESADNDVETPMEVEH